VILTRLIPCLLLRGNGLVKTKKFKDSVYVGDPVNAVRIFSEKEVDELVILDIDATREGREPNYELIAEIAGECFMPIAYGGGISTVAQARKLIRCGIEKVVINSASVDSTGFIREIADVFGSQAVVGSIDARKTLFGGHRVFVKSGTIETKLKPEDHAAALVQAGVGEILLNSIDCDGQMQGYDIELIKKVSARVNVPVVACGGAGTLDHMRSAMSQGGASAVAAGSMFVFYGKHRAVLINYPTGAVM
jgi:imidazole glycerol-phosphate synthase subunit HisF